jgi:hypothetical protein
MEHGEEGARGGEWSQVLRVLRTSLGKEKNILGLFAK